MKTLPFALAALLVAAFRFTAPAASLPEILAEEDTAKQLQLLCAWAEDQDEDALMSALMEHRGQSMLKQSAKARVVMARMKQLYPGKSEEDLRGILFAGRMDPMRDQPDPAKTLDVSDPTKALDEIADQPGDPYAAELQRVEILGEVAKKEPLLAIAILNTRRDIPRALAMRTIAEAWAELDADAALDWALALPPGRVKGYIESMIISAIAENDPEAAIAATDKLPPGKTADSLIDTLTGKLAAKKPEVALGWLKINRQLPSQQAVAICEALLSSHPELLPAFVEKQLAGHLAAIQLTNLTQVWVNKDEVGCVAWVRKLPPGLSQTSAVTIITKHLAKKDPNAAIAFARSIFETPDAQTYNWISGILAADDPQKAFTWLSSQPYSESVAGGWSVALATTSRDKPELALQTAARLPEGPGRTKAVSSLVNAWINSDFKGAVQWLAGQRGKPELNAYLKQASGTWKSKDLIGLANFYTQLPPENIDGKEVQSIAYDYGKLKPLEAVAWAASMPPSDGQRLGIQLIFTDLSTHDPTEAIKQAEKLTDTGARDSAVNGIVRVIAKDKPQEALRIAQTLATPAGRDEPLRYLANRLAEEDFAAAQAFVTALPPSVDRDTMTHQLVFRLAKKDGAAAMRLAGTLSDQTIGTTVHVLDEWKNQNPGAARTALLQSSLPEAKKQEILKKWDKK